MKTSNHNQDINYRDDDFGYFLLALAAIVIINILSMGSTAIA